MLSLPCCKTLLTYFQTYCMKHSPPWDFNLSSGNQEIPHILWTPKVHYCIRQCPPTFRILSQIYVVQAPHSTTWISIFILFSNIYLIHKVISVPQDSPPKPWILLSSRISSICLAQFFFSIWSPEKYLVSSADNKAPHYVVFCTPLLPRSPHTQIFSSAPYSHTLSP
jgi:hypothetical protein